ncbi:hypothetical protein V7138_14890 [Bacillus sp. JJ1533]|uniref:hypothetical protein n=1 Tax=Bacillus sp. JJ1533 TaxID=3122959 RepID=UPI002FFECC8F
MGLKKVSLVLNVDDPEQAELYKFVKNLPNGKKRNSSAFLRLLVDRAYQNEKIRQTKPVIRNQGSISFKVE